MVCVLGMFIVGLFCLLWFISFNWNFVFGVLLLYWVVKVFWVVSDYGIWWLYFVGGVVYNLVIVWVLFWCFCVKYV